MLNDASLTKCAAFLLKYFHCYTNKNIPIGLKRGNGVCDGARGS